MSFAGCIFYSTGVICEVSFKGDPAAGQALKATARPDNSLLQISDAVFQWQRCNEKEGDYTDIPGARSSAYTLTEADIGRYVRVRADNRATPDPGVFSGPTYCPVVAADRLVSSVPVTGLDAPVTGQALDTTVSAPPGTIIPVSWYDTTDTSYHYAPEVTGSAMAKRRYTAHVRIIADEGYVLNMEKSFDLLDISSVGVDTGYFDGLGSGHGVDITIGRMSPSYPYRLYPDYTIRFTFPVTEQATGRKVELV
ncbi:MAG: S-layer homology domain-containing protein [Treponematales bacterium]